MNIEDLKEPFSVNDIEWRVQQSGMTNGKPWAMVLAYVTNRAIQNRLDAVCGAEKWKNDFVAGPQGGVLCGISIKINDEWITKWDGADNTKIESIKGGLSDSMKRAAVQWGIGRYLYNLHEGWAKFVEDGCYKCKIENEWYEWNPPALLPEFLPAEERKMAGKEQEGNAEKKQEPESDPGDIARLEIRDRLFEMYKSKGYVENLVRLTEFEGSSGHVDGVQSLTDSRLTAGRLATLRGKVSKEFAAWKKGQSK